MRRLLLLFLIALAIPTAHAAASAASANAVTCPATGSSVQALAPAYARSSYMIYNPAGGGIIRVGFLASGTAAIDDTDSFEMAAGQTFSDSVPGVYIGRVVCMSTTASAITVYVVQTTKSQ